MRSKPPEEEIGILRAPLPGCARCAALAADRAEALRVHDLSAHTDVCVLMRQHHAADHR